MNVPIGVWIDEVGTIVRPTETAGSSDAFRTELDRSTKQMSAEARPSGSACAGAYLDALRERAEGGAASPYALPEARRAGACHARPRRTRSRPPTSASDSIFTRADTRRMRRHT